LFWAAYLFPASLGSYHASAPADIFLGKNFVVLDYGSGHLRIEPHFESGLTGNAAFVQWLVANVKLWHYVSAILGMAVMGIILLLSRSKQQPVLPQPALDITEILPGRLFLSSIGPVVQHWTAVRSQYNISAVLSITERDMPVLSGVDEHVQIKIADNRDADLYRQWRETAFDFIARNRCVLVHCEAGRSRSAATVMAFLLHSGVVDGPKEAYLFVKRLRKEVQPNVGFMRDVARITGETQESRDFVVRYWWEVCNLSSVIGSDEGDLELGWKCLQESNFHSAQAFLAVVREKRIGKQYA
jgi:dual specificity phosphatase 12